MNTEQQTTQNKQHRITQQRKNYNTGKYRVAIKFCFKAGLSATETTVLVEKAYGNEALNRSKVFGWYSRFREGRELVDDDERGGAKSTRNEVNIAAVVVGCC
jgi:hypothetical protein